MPSMDPTGMHLAAYLRYLKTRNRSERTMQSYSETLLLLSVFYDGADATELDRAQVEDFMLDQLARHKASSAAVRFRNLRAFYNWCVDEEIIDQSPMRRMSEPKPTDEPPPVTVALASTGRGLDRQRSKTVSQFPRKPPG